eukprot:3774108-Pleurochrysis_carterae.AAC.1
MSAYMRECSRVLVWACGRIHAFRRACVHELGSALGRAWTLPACRCVHACVRACVQVRAWVRIELFCA